MHTYCNYTQKNIEIYPTTGKEDIADYPAFKLVSAKARYTAFL